MTGSLETEPMQIKRPSLLHQDLSVHYPIPTLSSFPLTYHAIHSSMPVTGHQPSHQSLPKPGGSHSHGV